MITHSNITEDAITAFTCGDCWVFAWHVHKLTGWKVYTLDLDLEANSWGHVVCEMPDRRFFDIYGPQTEDEMYERWTGYYFIKPVPGSALESFDQYRLHINGYETRWSFLEPMFDTFSAKDWAEIALATYKDIL